MKWDLSELFKNNEEFYSEMDKVNRLYKDIEKYKDIELDSNNLETLLNLEFIIKERTNNILIYGSLNYYKNISSEECIKLKKDAENFTSDINTKLKFIDNKIINLGKDTVNKYIEQNKNLDIYSLYLNNLFRMKEHIQNDDVNALISENNKEINESLTQYNGLVRDMKYGDILIDGKLEEVNNSNYSKYISSRNRETRKQAYFSVNEAFKDKAQDYSEILDYIYDLRIKNAKLEKYDNVLEKVLFEENIDSKIVESLIGAVNNNLPLIWEYLKLKANLLNIEEPHLYDFGVPIDFNMKKKYSLDEAKEIINKALEPLGEEYLKVVNILLESHFDAELDPNKHQSITFSWHTYSFMNYRCSYNDLKNMIHELGHIVNYYFSMQEQPFVYEDSTIFVGETASLINEILLNRYLYNNATSKEEKIFYLSKEIENYFVTVYKQTMYTEFENELYLLKEKESLTNSLLSQTYNNIIKKCYGENIIYDEISSNEWMRLGHLYRWSYYPYKYATGLIMASVVVELLVDKKTLSVQEYLKFLKAGSSKYSLDLLKMLNVDLTDEMVINDGFKVLEKDIKELKKILNN